MRRLTDVSARLGERTIPRPSRRLALLLWAVAAVFLAASFGGAGCSSSSGPSVPVESVGRTAQALSGPNPGSLDPTFSGGWGVIGAVKATAIDPNTRKIYFAGQFAGPFPNIARLNTDGSLDTTFNPGGGPNNDVTAVAVDSSTGKVVIVGWFTSISGTSRNHVARLNTDGSLDTTFDPGGGPNTLWLHAVAIESSTSKVVIGGSFASISGTTRHNVARLTATGTLDLGFDPGTGPSDSVNAVAIESSTGKVVIGGWFSSVGSASRGRIARLTGTGTLDMSFDSSTGANNTVYAVAIDGTGNVVLGGEFTTVNGTPQNNIARLKANGSLDGSFIPGTGANARVNAVAIDSADNVVLGGNFTSISGTARNYVARLNAAGTVDGSFDPGGGPDQSVGAVAIESDTGKVVLGGGFTSISGTPRRGIARLNTTGTLDPTVNVLGSGPDGVVVAVATESSTSKIVLGGDFTSISGTPRNHIARLNANGSLDTSFDPGGGPNGQVSAVAIESSTGKVVIGGAFTSISGTPRNHIARLNANGSLDTSFDPGGGANQSVGAVAIDRSGRVVIGGGFTSISGTPRNYVARLTATGSLDGDFDPDGGADDWLIALAIDSLDRVVIGGWFSSISTTPRNYVARLNADGSLDGNFDPGSGADARVMAVAIEGSTGNVVLGGAFSSINGTPRKGFARLNADGSLDTSFDPGDGTGLGDVRAVAIESSTGKVVLGGGFDNISGTPRQSIARVNANGSLDTYFDPGTDTDNWVYGVAIDGQGHIVLGGSFRRLEGVPLANVGRLLGGGVGNGAVCASGVECPSTFCANGVCCNSACNSGCAACNTSGAVGTCTSLTSSAIMCRAAAGACDTAEYCNGVSPACPPDALLNSGIACGVTPECWTASKCDGFSASCPWAPPLPAGTRCTWGTCNALGICDVSPPSDGGTNQDSGQSGDAGGNPTADSGTTDASADAGTTDASMDAGASDAGSTGVIGPAGGTITVGAATVTIPPGALAMQTGLWIITSTKAAANAMQYAPVSAVYQCGPSGMTFASCVTVAFVYTSTVNVPVVMWSDSTTSGFVQMPTTITAIPGGQRASACVTHFSFGFVMDLAPDAGAADASSEAAAPDAAAQDAAAEASSEAGAPDAAAQDAATRDANTPADASRDATADAADSSSATPSDASPEGAADAASAEATASSGCSCRSVRGTADGAELAAWGAAALAGVLLRRRRGLRYSRFHGSLPSS